MPVSSLPENEKHTETLRRVLQRDSVQLQNQNLPSLSNFEGPWEMLAEFGFLEAFLGRWEVEGMQPACRWSGRAG